MKGSRNIRRRGKARKRKMGKGKRRKKKHSGMYSYVVLLSTADITCNSIPTTKTRSTSKIEMGLDVGLLELWLFTQGIGNCVWDYFTHSGFAYTRIDIA